MSGIRLFPPSRNGAISDEYPNGGTIPLPDGKTTLELHKYPEEIDGQKILQDNEPEVDDLNADDGEYVVRFFGYKLVIKREQE
jgi:hypothetical protein